MHYIRFPFKETLSRKKYQILDHKYWQIWFFYFLHFSDRFLLKTYLRFMLHVFLIYNFLIKNFCNRKNVRMY